VSNVVGSEPGHVISIRGLGCRSLGGEVKKIWRCAVITNGTVA